MLSFFFLFNFVVRVQCVSLILIYGVTSSEKLFHDCKGSERNTPNSSFRSNLRILLSVLSSNATRENGFYYSTAGRDSTNGVYGLFLCRGDVTTGNCKTCVDTAATEILKLCPNQTQAILWYEECLLRYANQSNFSSSEAQSDTWLINRQNVTQPSRFKQVLSGLMDGIIKQAVNSRSDKKFGTGNSSLSSSETLYGLAQCTPGMSSANCDSCLRDVQTGLSSCYDAKRGARIFHQNCTVRYETYPFYSLVASSPTNDTKQNQGKKKSLQPRVIIAIVVPVVSLLILIVMGSYFLPKKARDKYNAINEETDRNDIAAIESLQYDLSTLRAVTNNFSDDNKLGEGGFGKVYKGILPNGQEIAVKRLSKTSGQGIKELKNEALVVARLQHRNLVKLIGFCLEKEERILVYEFVPNKSLDYFLFDQEKQELLNWPVRYKIIKGIARAILYLHEDSRHKVIHRDLKASNVLLDENMNPKLSDFGMARIVGVDQSQANTNRIVGTYGYMSPEYAMFGQFSPKSDMYSFGVLILEIISGKKNSSFYHPEIFDNLPGHAFKHWRDGDPLKLVDPSLKDCYDRDEAMKCIHIGLLCVQEDMEERPTMATVMNIFNNHNVENSLATLPMPNQPAFFLRSRVQPNRATEQHSNSSTSKTSIPSSGNETSMTDVYPR